MLLHSCTTVSSTGYSTVKPYSRYLSGLSSAGPYRTVCVSTIQSIHDIRVKDSSGGECVTALRETAERGPETQDRRDRGETATAVARHRTYQHRLCAKNAAMNTCAVVGQTSDVARWDRGHTGPRPPRAGCRGRGGTTVCITRHRIRTSSKRKANTNVLSAVSTRRVWGHRCHRGRRRSERGADCRQSRKSRHSHGRGSRLPTQATQAQQSGTRRRWRTHFRVQHTCALNA